MRLLGIRLLVLELVRGGAQYLRARAEIARLRARHDAMADYEESVKRGDAYAVLRERQHAVFDAHCAMASSALQERLTAHMSLRAQAFAAAMPPPTPSGPTN